MLVEAAWSGSKAPGPLRAFYHRVRARRGMQVAAVATARKLAVLCWHLTIRQEDYAFAPSLIAHKQRKLELRAGEPSARGRKVSAARYSLAAVRAAERDLAAQSEAAYRTMGRRLGAIGPGAQEGGGRSRQQGDATHPARRLKQRGRISSPGVLLFASRSAAPATSPTLPRSSPRSRSFVLALRAAGAPP
jgi:hypothetical protein